MAAHKYGRFGAVKSVGGSAWCMKPHACMSEDQVRSDFGDFPPIPDGLHFYIAHPSEPAQL
jgi:hypothetical protein